MRDVDDYKISPELLAKLSDRGDQRTYAQGELLIGEGEVSTEMYILLAGELTCFTSDANGREMVLNVLTPGEFFGELSLDGGARSASVKATHGSICVVVPQSEVRAVLGEYPEFAEALVRKLIARVRTATLQAKGAGAG